MPAVSLSSVKAHLNITSTTHDDELLDTLERAEAMLERRVGPLTPVTVTDEVHSGPGPILLRRHPVVSVASATSNGLAVTDLSLGSAGLLYGTFTGYPRQVKVTYTTGRPVLPLDLEAAVLELVSHLWSSQRGAVPVSPIGLQDGAEDLQTPGGSFLLPYRVQSLIEPYLLPAIA